MKALAFTLVFAACQKPIPCRDGATLAGIDVSVYQGNIDWPKVKAAGACFAIQRVADGLDLDTNFDSNWAGSKGLVRGVYQYFRPGTDPLQQAELLLSKARLGEGDLPAVMDLETTDGQSNEIVIANMKLWLDRVEKGSGRLPLIYTSPGFYSSLGNPDFSRYLLWVAHWETDSPTLPGAWSQWTFWQHADDGKLDGINGPVDLDQFNGNRAALAQLASGPPSSHDVTMPLATIVLVGGYLVGRRPPRRRRR